MLKIKDNVDLKELEKFGLKPKYNEDNGKIDRYEKITYDDNGIFYYKFRRFLRFLKTNKKKMRFKNYEDMLVLDDRVFLNGTFNRDDSCDFDLLYDLIQAGLVEKVE